MNPSVHVAFATIIAFLATSAIAAENTTARRYELLRGGYGYDLVVEKRPVPTPDKDQVLVRMRAVSLNHRDLYMLEDSPGANPPGECPFRTVPVRSSVSAKTSRASRSAIAWQRPSSNAGRMANRLKPHLPPTEAVKRRVC